MSGHVVNKMLSQMVNTLIMMTPRISWCYTR